MDHLTRIGTEDETWQRPPGNDDIQDTIEEQIVPVTALGIWDYSQTKPYFLLSNALEIEHVSHIIC